MAQGNQSGFTMMQRSGDQNQLDAAAQQQLIAALLKNSLQAPQRPELSWTQGAARMLEAGVSAYKQKQLNDKTEAQALVRGNDMKQIGAALTSNDPQKLALVMQGLKDPQSQSMVMNLLSNMQNQNQLHNQALQMNGVNQVNTRENKRLDYGYKSQETAQTANNASNLSNQNAQQDVVKDSAKTSGESARDVTKVQAEADVNAKAKAQNRMLDLNKVINSDARQDIKDLASKELATLVPLNAQMAHPQGVANTNTSMMSGNGVAPNPGAAGGGGGKGGAGAPPDIQSLATKARDNNAQINNVLRNIQGGVLNDQNTSEAGRQAVNLAATAGVPGAANTEGAIKEYEQVSAQAGLGGLKDFISGIGGSRMPKTLIDMVQQATMDKNDNVSGAAPKLFLQKQINDRVIGLGGLEQEWINKNGAINYPDKTTGYNWEQANNAYMLHNPIVTQDDYQKNIQNKMASAGNAAPQSNSPVTQQAPIPASAQQPQQNVSQPQEPRQSDQIAPSHQSDRPLAQPADASQQSMPLPPPPLPQQQQQSPQQNIVYAPSDPSQNMPSPQSQGPAQPQMDQGQMLAQLLAKKQQDQQNPYAQVPDYSSMFSGGSNSNMSF